MTGTELESSWTWVLDPVVQFKGGVGTCLGGKRAVCTGYAKIINNFSVSQAIYGAAYYVLSGIRHCYDWGDSDTTSVRRFSQVYVTWGDQGEINLL